LGPNKYVYYLEYDSYLSMNMKGWINSNELNYSQSSIRFALEKVEGNPYFGTLSLSEGLVLRPHHRCLC